MKKEKKTYLIRFSLFGVPSRIEYTENYEQQRKKRKEKIQTKRKNQYFFHQQQKQREKGKKICENDTEMLEGGKRNEQ
jgi:hypothetical protein